MTRSQADEPLLEVSTDKVDTEIPAPASGVLLAITAGEDEVVAVGGELGVIGAADEAGAAAARRSARCARPVAEPVPVPPPAPVAEPVAPPVAEAPAAAAPLLPPAPAPP